MFSEKKKKKPEPLRMVLYNKRYFRWKFLSRTARISGQTGRALTTQAVRRTDT